MNLPINLVDNNLYKEIIRTHIRCVLADAMKIYIFKYQSRLEKLAAILAWETREIFRPIYDWQLKNLHS